MSPIDFIRRPWVWLKALSQYECVCSAAPNFAFALVTRKMPDNVYNQLDLSHVTGILSGAEPVRRQTVEQFVEVSTCTNDVTQKKVRRSRALSG